MNTLAVKGLNRPLHYRSKSSSRTNRNTDSQSERDVKSTRDSSTRKVSAEVKDDALTAAFVRRVLCAGQLKAVTDNGSVQALEELLPPLTSSNEVDLQLYAIISVIIKDFVQAWYNKITPDHEFVDEVVQIIAHCTRGLEQRLRRVDLESLVLDEIPELINQHAEAFKAAQSTASAETGRVLGSDARTIYHALQPHPALSPVPSAVDPTAADTQRANEAVWRQLLIEGVLDHLLPPEDLQNPCLKVLVSEIFSEMIVGNVLGGKVCQGWFLWDVTTKAVLAARPVSIPPSVEAGSKKSSRLDQYGLLSDQTSGREAFRARPRVHSVYALIVNIGWEILRVALLLFGTIRSLFVQINDAAVLPSRFGGGVRSDSGGLSLQPPSSATSSCDAGSNVAQQLATKQDKVAVLDMAAWRVPMHLLGLNVKMPWLVGALSLVQHFGLSGPGRIGAADSRMDRLISYHLTTTLFAPSRLPLLLKTLRANLFPNNSLAPGVPPPSTPDEIAAIKRRCAQTILSLIPDAVRRVYFGSGTGENAKDRDTAAVECIEQEILVLFEDEYMNKHFLFALVEVVVCRLFPELAVQQQQ